MPAVLVWIVMVVGPDFVIEARWAPLRFSGEAQCEQWLADELHKGVVKLSNDVTAKCRPLDLRPADIEE
jgi:hypothetical protein